MKLLRWLHGPSCRCYDDSYDAEAAVYEHDPRHVRPESLHALMWQGHQQSVETYHPIDGPYRGFCYSCDWVGEWMLTFIAADWDADMHLQRAPYP